MSTTAAEQAQTRKETWQRRLLLVFSAGLILLVFSVFFWYSKNYWYLTPHWEVLFKPATFEMLRGRSPYGAQPMFFYPPWVLLPLVPLALLPDIAGQYLISLIAILSYGYVAYRLGAKPLTLAVFLFTPPVLINTFAVNMDWMVPLGFILPPQIGLFFVLIKPQVGIGIAVFWLVEAWRKGRVREVVRVFAPVTLAYLLSFALYGLWPLGFSRTTGYEWNLPLWPWMIPAGLALLVAAIRHRRSGLAILASPFLSPYISNASLGVTVLGLLPYQLETIAAAVGMWVVWGIHGI